MNIQLVAGIVCSVGMFLFGIDLMGDALEKCCGEKMKHFLSVCTKTPFSGMLSGLIVTGIIQSSSATTVMAVSFVDSGLMSLFQAVGIVMGANIGTTVTSLLIAINFSAFAPVAVFIGTFMKMFCKAEKKKQIGLVIAGFGFLFVAMSSMSEYLSFLKNSQASATLLASSTGRIVSLVAGFIITAIMQSSSATVGVLQSAAASGLVSMHNALYILFGQNIGAVVPALLSAVNSKKDAKRVAVIHFLFNTFGTLIFMVISEITPYCSLLEKIESPSMAVSVAHIVFNAVTTAVLLPFGKRLVIMSEKIIRN